MGNRNDRRRRRPKEREKERERPLGYFVSDASELSKEKQKARDLKNTPWWRKKTAQGLCHYCKRKFEPDGLTMDHIIPLVRGGKSERNNLVPCCRECNSKKKFLLPAEWREYLETIKKAGR